jgi:hypothetical protein
MQPLRQWLGRSAFLNSRWGFGAGLAGLSLPVFLTAGRLPWQWHHFHADFDRSAAPIVALLGSVALFGVGSLIFPPLRSVGVFLGRAAVLIATEAALMVLVPVGLLMIPYMVLGVILSIAYGDLGGFAIAALMTAPIFRNSSILVGELAVPALIVMVLWSELYFLIVRPPAQT